MYRTPVYFDRDLAPIMVDVVAIRNLGPKSIITIEYAYEDLEHIIARQTIIVDTHLVIGLN